MADAPEPQRPSAEAKRAAGVNQALVLGLSMLVAAMVLLVLGRGAQAIVTGIFGAFFAVGSLIGGKSKRKRRRSR